MRDEIVHLLAYEFPNPKPSTFWGLCQGHAIFSKDRRNFGCMSPCSQCANICSCCCIFAVCEYVLVHAITQRRLTEFWQRHPAAKSPLMSWYKATRTAQWKSFANVQRTFNSADNVDPFVVFDVGGNNFRIVAKVEYRFGTVFIAHVFTHAEYERWNR